MLKHLKKPLSRGGGVSLGIAVIAAFGLFSGGNGLAALKGVPKTPVQRSAPEAKIKPSEKPISGAPQKATCETNIERILNESSPSGAVGLSANATVAIFTLKNPNTASNCSLTVKNIHFRFTHEDVLSPVFIPKGPATVRVYVDSVTTAGRVLNTLHKYNSDSIVSYDDVWEQEPAFKDIVVAPGASRKIIVRYGTGRPASFGWFRIDMGTIHTTINTTESIDSSAVNGKNVSVFSN